jgi:hypothetical protein
MAQANSDNAGVNATLDKFFGVFTANSGPAVYKNIDILINEVFCADDGEHPWIGIAHHGPQFRGTAAIRALYNQVFTSFPDIWWGPSTDAPPQTTAPVPPVPLAPRLYSNDAYAKDPSHHPTIGVQTTMAGTLQQPWFQGPGYSLPLSGLTPAVPPKRTNTPSFAVFAFGAQDPTRVSRISFYMDRYNQARELQPIGPLPFDTDIRALLQHLEDRAETQRLIELNRKTQSDLSRLVETLERHQRDRP